MSTLSPREIMRRCIHFQRPPRRGYYFFGEFGPNDTVIAFEWFRKDARGVDPWGITWEVHPDFPSIGIVKEHPLQETPDWSRLTAPDPAYYAALTREGVAALTAEQREKYRVIASSSGIWERPQYFRGMENLFDDFLEDPDTAHRLIDFCADFWVAYLEALAPLRGEIDALYMFDDWGTQEAAMISPAMWRTFFAAPYRRIVDAAHAQGMDFWLHSCGRVTELIEEFIGVGMDLLNPYQSGTCGYEEVAARYAGRIAFMTSVDTQRTLVTGPPEAIRDECARLARWGTPEGGLVVGYYGYDIPPAHERIVLDYFQARDRVECAGGGVSSTQITQMM